MLAGGLIFYNFFVFACNSTLKPSQTLGHTKPVGKMLVKLTPGVGDADVGAADAAVQDGVLRRGDPGQDDLLGRLWPRNVASSDDAFHRDYLDRKIWKINKKKVFHFFCQQTTSKFAV